jgi:hypothetical protein
MLKKGLLSLVFLLSAISIFGTSLNITYDVPYELEDGVNSCVQETLDLVLSPYLIVDDDLLDVIYLKVETLEYIEEDNSLLLNFDTNYKEQNLNFDIQIIKAKSKGAIFDSLSKKLLNAYKYDLSSLFEKNNNWVIDYYSPYLASFNFGEENSPKEAQYFYVRNKADDIVGVANINTLFENDATLNIISNNKLTPNLKLTDGPSGSLATGLSYDFYDGTIFNSVGYTLYKSFIPFLTNANLLIEGGGAFNSTDAVKAFYIDAGLSIELPLSLLFSSEGFFKNSDIRVTVLGGAAQKDGIHFNSKYTVGYGIYLSNKYNIELYYENNTIFTSLSDSSFIIGMRLSVLL